MNIIKLRMQFAQLNGMDKIFVIDDDKNLLQVMKSLLHLRGFNVSIFRNWEIAYQLMKLFKPQLILLDVFLKGIDGLEVCQRLKASPFTKHIPIILCSGYPQIAERGIREYGAADFIAKPFELDDLINKMHSVLSKR
ncbi:MAG TPA: response regulator [Ginsengibacter sp.]|jgi:CheY-like chemotaxis protein